MRGMFYALEMHKEASDPALAIRRRRIPLPGHANPESQLGVPLLVRGDLVGVLVLESEVRYRFHEEDKALIELFGSYLAIAIQNMQMHERSADAAGEAPPEPVRAPVSDAEATPARNTPREIAYYVSDECILVDGEYLIRSLPAKILWRLLTIRDSTGRDEFTIASCGSISRSTFQSGRTIWKAACCCYADGSSKSVPSFGSRRVGGGASPWS